ncbi:MAG: peptide chain release factor N(5)-glutamine methyltransferase [Chitinophagaceae bacterium]|nr:peptide chain release factor N(5)-glutamine methyltransferase [Chitinophagaceae bacterium]
MQWAHILAFLKTHTAKWYSESEQESIARRLVEDLSGTSFMRWKLNQMPTLNEQVLHHYLTELATGKPLQYVLGYEYFSGMKLKVNEHVLIPRPETDELVQWIVSECSTSPHRVLDMGTGSGCIALGLKKACSQFIVHALDVSENALAVARENAREQGLSVEFHGHDILLNTWPFSEPFTLWVSNPPYILLEEKGDMTPQVLEHEPHTALFVSNHNALQFYMAIEAHFQREAPQGAYLFFELSAQAEAIVAYFKNKEEYILHSRHDMYGKLRMLCLIKK